MVSHLSYRWCCHPYTLLSLIVGTSLLLKNGHADRNAPRSRQTHEEDWNREAIIYNEPYFETRNNQTITVPLGGTAYLTCKIRNLGDRTISWIRQRDLNILTSDNYTFTTDRRVRAILLSHSNDYTLELRDVQLDDEGVYECQASTETKISVKVNLRVIAVKTVIEKAEDGPMYVAKGSPVRLTCDINYWPNDSSSTYVFWYHNGRLLNYDTNERGVDVRTEHRPDPYGGNGGGSTRSTLLIRHADRGSSGNYTCKLQSPSFVTSESSGAPTIAVYIDGETPAAISDKGRGESAGQINGSSNKRSDGQMERTVLLGLLAAGYLWWYRWCSICR